MLPKERSMKRERKEVAENGQCFSGQAASLPPSAVSAASQCHRGLRAAPPVVHDAPYAPYA
jgi:hypothetical protein